MRRAFLAIIAVGVVVALACFCTAVAIGVARSSDPLINGLVVSGFSGLFVAWLGWGLILLTGKGRP